MSEELAEKLKMTDAEMGEVLDRCWQSGMKLRDYLNALPVPLRPELYLEMSLLSCALKDGYRKKSAMMVVDNLPRAMYNLAQQHAREETGVDNLIDEDDHIHACDVIAKIVCWNKEFVMSHGGDRGTYYWLLRMMRPDEMIGVMRNGRKIMLPFFDEEAGDDHYGPEARNRDPE